MISQNEPWRAEASLDARSCTTKIVINQNQISSLSEGAVILLRRAIILGILIFPSVAATHAHADPAEGALTLSSHIVDVCFGTFKSDVQSKGDSTLDMSGYLSWFFRDFTACLEYSRKNLERHRILGS